jgi:hypothetical protein
MSGYFTMRDYLMADGPGTRAAMARHNETVLAEEIDSIKRLGNQLIQDTPGTPEYAAARRAEAEVAAYVKFIKKLGRAMFGS